MARQSTKRKDKDRIVLRKGECQRPNGSYDYRWTDQFGKRHVIYGKTLEELREKEKEVDRDISDGIKAEKRNTTINELFDLWCHIKRGLKDNTFQNYKYMYNTFVRPKFGKLKISQVTKCSVCGDVKSTKTVYYPKTIKLSATSYTYNGKAKTPTVTVKDSKGNTLKKDTDYTVKYASGRKNPGKYTITVTFKGKYEGTKKLTFTVKPAKAALSKVTAGSKQATVAWKTVTGATGYEVQYSTSSKLRSSKTATVKKGSTKKTTIKKLTKGKKYYFRVRAYKTIDGKKVYGAWSSVKSVKIK